MNHFDGLNREVSEAYSMVADNKADGMTYQQLVNSAAKACSIAIVVYDTTEALSVLGESILQAQVTYDYRDLSKWRSDVAYVLYMITREY